MNQNSASSTGDGNTNHPPKKQITASKHWCFTFNNYVENDIIELMNSNVDSVSKYVFQEETSKSGTKHLQGYMEFTRRLRPKNLFNEKIHWERCRNIKNSIAYCQKIDTRTGQIYTKGITLIKQIKILDTNKLYPWQKELLDIIDEEPSERTIYWRWENTGNTGKSSFCKYLCVKKDALILSGKGADMKYGIVKYYEKKGEYPKLIILDIPRSCENYISWTGIEEVKNACFFSPKYEGSMIVGNCPHLIVMANFHPNMNKISMDRWDIKNIELDCDDLDQ